MTKASFSGKIMVLLLHNMLAWFLSFSYLTRTSSSLDTLAVNQSLLDGQSLVSASGNIAAGFFSPGDSTRKYLGVWYKNVSPYTVVWVANRETPLQNNYGVLKLNENGILLVLDGASNNTLWWSFNKSSKAENNTSVFAQLLDSGNLVVRNTADKDSFLWQSFDYPCDTMMPGMKIGWNLETGLERFLSSWKSSDDPAKGEYTKRVDLRGYPQVLTFKGSHIISATGQWNGESLRGNLSPDPRINQTFVVNEKEVYYEFEVRDRSSVSLYRLLPSGDREILSWKIGSSNNSKRVAKQPRSNECDLYARCGANSICSSDSYLVTCECLKGYVPKFPQQWSVQNWTDGCVPRNKSICKNSYTDDFWTYTNSNLPDTSSSWFNKTMNLEECKESCLRNCSCVAYANLYVTNGGTGCLLWFHNMVDVSKYSQWGQDLYVRVPPLKLDQVAADGHRNIKKIAGITVGVIIFGFITCLSILIIKNPGAATNFYYKHRKNKPRKEDIDLPIFDLSVLAHATENFSNSNKLGEGGFGPVYKGTLIDGQEIAVKRLSKKSRQGLEEFKTEVALIAKLQHRNLVKLLGCYIKGEEKMLIYEYMPNKSLDYFVFDETKRMSLDWLKRFNIIRGIARGLLYLHQDSRLRIIHRDLKTSNILLDANFNSKISDFGLARIFLGDQIEANTNRVAGTYGYMPPEYAVRGLFSMKSDVFSYGVIVLEIVSGKKNREFSDPKHDHNLLGYAWRLWSEDRALELFDEVLRDQCTPFEVIRCVQVGLLCVQQRPEDRPDMLSVVLMLNGEKLLPQPKVPGFYTEKDVRLKSNPELYSANEVTITELDAR